jgi:membrane fusion protein (multidrug efflux system)
MPTVTQEDPKEKSLNDAGEQTDEKTNSLKPADQGNKSQEAEPQTGEPKKDEGNKEEQDKKSEAETKKPVDPATKRRTIIIGVCIGIVLWWVGWHGGFIPAPTNLQMTRRWTATSTPLPLAWLGRFTAVYVENDQPVKAGEPLVDLDPSDYRVQVDQARANYEQAIAQASAQGPNVPITQVSNRTLVDTDEAEVVNAEAAVASAQRDYDSNAAKLRQAEANNLKSQADLVRFKKLVDKEEIAKSDYDQYIANAGSGVATVEASQFTAASSAKVVEEKRALLLEQQSKLFQAKANSPRMIMIQKATFASTKAAADSAKAQLDTALLNLSYCHIVAPVDGIASQRSAEIGGRISVGQQLIVLVQTATVWTTANFKETQLKKMHVGQRVNIYVDSLGESFEGEVQNMPAASGDRSSLFPPENATGNYVKIVQRLPVRILFRPNQRDWISCAPACRLLLKFTWIDVTFAGK